MLPLLVHLWLVLCTNCCLSLHRTTRRYRRNVLPLDGDNNLTAPTTPEVSLHVSLLKLLSRFIVAFLICIGLALLIVIAVAVGYFYVTCSRPERIHEQISIEYLDTHEMINYSDAAT